MKKIIYVITIFAVCFLFVFGLSSCDISSSNKDDKNNTTNSTTKQDIPSTTNDTDDSTTNNSYQNDTTLTNPENNTENSDIDDNVYFTITFKDYDGVILQTSNVKKGDTPTYNKSNPTRENDDNFSYTFSDWTPTISKISEDTEYIAEYTKKELPYNITINLNGGTSSTTKLNFKTDKITSNMLPFDVVKKGYAFKGYELNGIKVYDENGNVVNNYKLSSNMTFKAIYEEVIILTIYYTLYNPKTNKLIDTFDIKPTNMGNVSETRTYRWNTPVDLIAKPNEGYSFVGWFHNGLALSNEEKYNYMMWEEDVVLEARFEYTKYDLEVWSNNTDLGQVLIKQGNSQIWYNEQTQKQYYTETTTIAAYSKTETRFLGWYDENNNLVSTSAVYTLVMLNRDYKLEAKWNNFYITYDLGAGAVIDGENPTNYNIDMENLEIPFQPRRYVCTFIGWEFNSKIITEIDTSNACHMTITAKWQAIEELALFEFTSSFTNDTIAITGIKDKTIKNIVVPNLVTDIVEGAFSGCSSLESITLPFIGDKEHASNDTYQYPFGYIFGTSSYDNSIETLQKYYYSTSWTKTPTYYIPSTLKEVIIAKSAHIQSYAFYNCSTLTRVVIPDGVKSIQKYAFYNCSSLTSIEIPSSVTNIESSVFYNCFHLSVVHNLSNLELSINSTSNGYVAYYASFVYTSKEEIVISIIDDKYVFAYVGKAFLVQYLGNESKLILPESVIIDGNRISKYEICNYAFYNCSSLIKIIVPNSVTYIPEGAFNGCSSLQSISLPFIGDKVKNVSDTHQYLFGYIFGSTSYDGGVGTSQYYYKSNGTNDGGNIYYIPASLKEVIITDVKYIQSSAFDNCSSLTSVVIPYSVTNIGQYAFFRCTSLQAIYYGGTATQWKNIIISTGNDTLTSSTIYYYSEEKPTVSGNYWHYVDDEIVLW